MGVWLNHKLVLEKLGVEILLEIAEEGTDVHVSLREIRDIAPGGTLVFPDGPEGDAMLEDLRPLHVLVRTNILYLKCQARILSSISHEGYTSFPDILASPGVQPEYLSTTNRVQKALRRLEDLGLIEHHPTLEARWRRANPGGLD